MSGTQVLLSFAVVVVTLLVIDLFVVHRRTVTVTVRSALVWSLIWIGAGVVFGFAVFSSYDDGSALADYFAVFVVEKSLSVDNVFLWLVVFTALGVPKGAQRRVLLYGVLGALILRFGALSAGAAIMERFTWVLWIAGAFLIYAAYKMWAERHHPPGVGEGEADTRLARALRRVLRTTDGYRGQKFVVREAGKVLATPLLVALILIELTDVVMAMDALPATLSITTDVAVLMPAVGFALLGLRALFFVLAGIAERLRYLKVAVAVILFYIGATLIIENIIETFEVSTAMSLAVIGVVLVAAVVASIRSPRVIVPGEDVRPDPGEQMADDVGSPARDESPGRH